MGRRRLPLTVAVLEVMWDDRHQTSAANPNYLAEAPRAFRISPKNFSGGRLYRLVGHSNLLVTNVCPQLVSSAKGRGNPDTEWLTENLERLDPKVLLVCGKVAQQTFNQSSWESECRQMCLPHPAARSWTSRALTRATEIIQQWEGNYRLIIQGGKLRATKLW